PSFDRAAFLGRGEVRRQRQRHRTGRGPFRAALERGDETDAAHAVEIVTHRRVEDAAIAVHHRPDNRLVFARAAFVFRGESGREQMDVFTGAAHAVIELIGGVQPFVRHAFGYGMVSVADRHLERVLGAVAGAGTLAFGHAHLFAAVVDDE